MTFHIAARIMIGIAAISALAGALVLVCVSVSNIIDANRELRRIRRELSARERRTFGGALDELDKRR